MHNLLAVLKTLSSLPSAGFFAALSPPRLSAIRGDGFALLQLT
jgi:hypothetical protein